MVINGAKHSLAALKKVEKPAAAPIAKEEEIILPIEEDIQEEYTPSFNRYKNVKILPVEEDIFEDIDLD